MFDYWDAMHYSAIAVEGYSGPVRWAFYPLYPLLVGLISTIVRLKTRPDLVGFIFSTLILLTFCYWQARIAATTDQRLHGLKPETIWGWLLFLLWPASWVFHSHHTESLFILLSFAAFVSARHGRWKLAAVMAGLCALTRNQGVFVGVAVAIESAWLQQHRVRKLTVFAGSGLIAFFLFSTWPLYQLWAAGSPFMSLKAQGQFSPQATTLHQIVGTIWFSNYWQHATWNFYLHHLAFILLNVSVGFLLRRREYALGVYVFLSLWGPLYLGQLENQFRYGAILFPALFVLGDAARNLPWSIRWTAIVALTWLHLVCTWDYAVGRWAY
jgi:Gpi18-like mannosyltransferase